MIVSEKFLNKKDILKGEYYFPKENLVLIPSRHALEMIENRKIDTNKIPMMICVTNNNIYSAKCRDGKRLHSVVIKLKYDKIKDLFICLNPFDSAMKTIWLNNKNIENGVNFQT